MSSRLALVFCVHHKPWLMMSTLITILAQDHQDFDLYVLYNLGLGDRKRDDGTELNSQLSPFDERVRDVCRIRRIGVFEIEYCNDDSLDSGAWYKFICEGRWRSYDWVFFAGEGTLFARSETLSAMLTFVARNPNVQVIASAHEKRRIPKAQFLRFKQREGETVTDRLHDHMIAETFRVFCRDPEFCKLYDAWESDFESETQYHVPDVGRSSELVRRIHSKWSRSFGAPSDGGFVRQLPWAVEYLDARLRFLVPMKPSATVSSRVYANRTLRSVDSLADVQRCGHTGFHRVAPPEWFGCTPIHLMSRTFLERFTAKLEQHRMYDVLSLRFSATALEIVWGFLPAWLGFEKWFTDGFHRVRKDPVTYRREDYPVEMATYINRYYRGQLIVRWSGDHVRVRDYRRGLERLREQLPAVYF